MAKRGSRGRGGSVRRTKSENGALEGVSAVDLQRELQRRESVLKRLHGRRRKLMDNLSTVEQQIAGMGGSARGASGGGGGRTRARNETNLVGALSKVLTGATMSVTDIAQEVQRRGYVTTSPNFRTIVNQTLINSGQFKRTGRGMYTFKG